MLKPVIAVFDKKISLYDNPFAVRHVGEAIRQFETLTKDPQTKFGQHPTDYELYQIGTYDEESGLINPSSPIHLFTGNQQ